LRTFLRLLLERLDRFGDRLAVNRVVLGRLVVNDGALGPSILPESIHAPEALPQAVEARRLGHQGVEVEICPRLDALRADDDSLRALRTSNAAGLNGRPELAK